MINATQFSYLAGLVVGSVGTLGSVLISNNLYATLVTIMMMVMATLLVFIAR
jgi:hypothetical protein